MANSFKVQSGYLGQTPNKSTQDFMIIDDRAYKIHKVVVHTFRVGDAEDPVLYAAEPLLEWQNSEEGKWIMNHAVETPAWHQQLDVVTYGYKFSITAKLKDKDFTFWTLKWNSR